MYSTRNLLSEFTKYLNVCRLCTTIIKNSSNFLPSTYERPRYNTSISIPSKSPVAWCQKHWVHFRALKSAFSVEAQLQEITSKLKQVNKLPSNVN